MLVISLARVGRMSVFSFKESNSVTFFATMLLPFHVPWFPYRQFLFLSVNINTFLTKKNVFQDLASSGWPF